MKNVSPTPTRADREAADHRTGADLVQRVDEGMPLVVDRQAGRHDDQGDEDDADHGAPTVAARRLGHSAASVDVSHEARIVT